MINYNKLFNDNENQIDIIMDYTNQLLDLVNIPFSKTSCSSQVIDEMQLCTSDVEAFTIAADNLSSSINSTSLSFDGSNDEYKGIDNESIWIYISSDMSDEEI